MAKKRTSRSVRRRKQQRRKKILFGIEVAVLVFLGLALAGYTWLTRTLDQIERPEFQDFDIKFNEEVQAGLKAEDFDYLQATNSGTQILALVGLDTRADGELSENMNSDTIILCCIDHDRKEIRMVSIMRDTWMNIAESSDDGYEFSKANAAYNRGGPARMLTMLNTNLDLAVTDYVSVNFKALADAIDILGGLDVEMSNAECVHTNNYNTEVCEIQGVPYETVDFDESLGDEHVEVHHLSGALAVSYARIRKGAGEDARRTSRQRTVINLMVQKIRSNPDKIPQILNSVMDDVTTSLTTEEILKTGMIAMSYKMTTSYAYPFVVCYGENVKDALGVDVVIPVTLEDNVRDLHAYLFPDEDYSVSATVQDYSYYIAKKSGYDESHEGDVLHQGPGSEALSVVAGE